MFEYDTSTNPGVFPNGIRRDVFYPRDKQAMRHKYALPPDQFLVGYVGNFIPPKGAARLGQATNGLANTGGVFMGSGSHPPQADNIVFCKRVTHEAVPELLSACDVFVLPTKIEGCSNATLEAMACGLPVIASDGAFNDDILNDDVAIRVNPMDIEAIREVIVALRDNPQKRARMSRCAMQWSEQFDINRRARNILEWMKAK